jgi:Na+-translocating ferredoxin:NAD+ oxidoreductase RnfG subunit
MMALGGALSLPFALAEKSFAGFDDRMRLVQAVTSSTGEEFDALVKTAQRLGRETSFTAQEVADAMTGLGRMGFDPSEITAAIEHVLNLSRATGTDLSESADIAANSLRIFGMEAGKMSHVADILTATANGSAQTLTDLFEGLKMAGPQAAAAGENISELCASLGIMANMGIKGSLAGTALRKAYVQFADVKVQNVLRDVGVEAVDANGNTVGYVFSITNRNAYNPPLKLALGMKPDGTIEKIAFIELNETPGKGSLADEPKFKDQFDGRSAESLVLNGDGDSGIDAISGATVTSKAVLNAVNAGLDFFRNVIMGGGR